VPDDNNWYRDSIELSGKPSHRCFRLPLRRLSTKKAHLSPRSVAIEQANLKHLNLFFGKIWICDVRAEDIAHYQASRKQDGAAPKTINLEVGTLKAILRKNRLWFAIQQDVRMLRVSEDARRDKPRGKDRTYFSVSIKPSTQQWCWR